MGCVSSKQTVSVTPALDYSGALHGGKNAAAESFSGCGRVSRLDQKSYKAVVVGDGDDDDVLVSASSGRISSAAGYGSESVSFRLGNLQKYVEGEQVAAGWPAWLSAVAGEAIQGWVPLSADAFEKLEKIGQGTYSSVFRARDLDSGKIVALKKVRFDNFEPESVRFMAREIVILRRLDHPNVIKLEGIIASKLSSSIYLVFEYMEHDLSGLSSCPDIRFSEAQVKCYMKQLLSGLEHCHSRGIMHRDIKGSNLLVNNEGILKVADFGLANFTNKRNRQPLTSRVVTLWYRPPELLLGATDYGPSVDVWSVGCVFAEVLLGKPLLQGRTEVEQLHKIFKLCGSPPDEYWKKSKLPHATLFKPQQHYNSSLVDTCKDLPKLAVSLIETLLSVDPNKRGSASSILSSEYFSTKPYPCDPSSLPKYPPNKEIDAKCREEARRKNNGGRARGHETARKPTTKQNGLSKLAPVKAFPSQGQDTLHRIKISGNLALFPSEDENSVVEREPPKVSLDQQEVSLMKNPSQGEVPYSGPMQVPTSSGFTWVKKQRENSSRKSHSRSSSKASLNGFEAISSNSLDKNYPHLKGGNKYRNTSVGLYEISGVHECCESVAVAQPRVQRQWSQFDRPDSFDANDIYHSQDLASALNQKGMGGLRRSHKDQEDKVEFSGPLLSHSHRIDDLIEKHEHQIRQALRKSWFQKGKEHGKIVRPSVL